MKQISEDLTNKLGERMYDTYTHKLGVMRHMRGIDVSLRQNTWAVAH